MPARSIKPINGYVEITSPQLLDDKWNEFNFNLTSEQNVLQDFSLPESGSGYVYRDAKLIGSATHNRFLYWRTTNDVLELVELSTEVVLEGNQVKIKFENSPIINHVNVIEFSDSIVIIIPTLTSVHRLHLSHPKTTNRSVLSDISPEMLYNPSNHHIFSPNSNGGQQPICASSWHDATTLKCALSFPDSSILIAQFGINSHHITTYDIKQTGVIGRLWSRMPNLWARNPNDCDNAVFVIVPYYLHETKDVLLFTLCRDFKIRVFSTLGRECVYSHNMIPQSSFSQSFASHTNPTTELPMMKISGSQIIVYLTENRPEFVLLEYAYCDGQHQLNEIATVQTPCWEKLIDFSVTKSKIWALANIRETESALCFMELDPSLKDDGSESILQGHWDFVNSLEETELPNSTSLVAEIFWSNHFSVSTVQKALAAIAGPNMPRKNNMEALEELAFTRIVDEDQDQAWTRFYNYCLQNHQIANKSIGLVVANDESVVSIIKRSNPTFICPWLESADVTAPGGPYRGIEFPTNAKAILGPLNIISTDLMDEEHSNLFEQKLFENPVSILATVEEIVSSLTKARRSALLRLNSINKNLIASGISYICDQLDLTSQANLFNEKVLQEYTTKLKSDHNPLGSNCGIIITFELFRRLVRARMILLRDVLVYIHLVLKKSSAEPVDKVSYEFCESLYTSGTIKRLIDSIRSYATLVWLTDTPIKTQTTHINPDVINSLSSNFEFFKSARDTFRRPVESAVETVLNQNLLMNFLAGGGLNFSWSLTDISQGEQTVSNSHYVSDLALNLCYLLWPGADHLCLAEYMYTNQFDEHLTKYLDLTQEWLSSREYDRHFMRAANCMLQNRAMQAVDIFNRLWMNISSGSLIDRFTGFDQEKDAILPDGNIPANPNLIYRYYERLIQLFQTYNNRQCLVVLINHCMSLLNDEADDEQANRINCLRAKLFQFNLELEDFDEAYHTMVLTDDSSLRINCLRKFIVSHCEKEQWSNLLSYPFIDIKQDFIHILNQKADSSDLSDLSQEEFYKTSFYDLLFASYVSDEEFREAASVMFSYAQRLAHEVPGIRSIRKQADCLLIALNSLRCVECKNKYIESESTAYREDGRSSVLKRSYDCETNANTILKAEDGDATLTPTKIDCKEIERQYELTRARLRLLERDQTANAIVLSPLKPEETIAQLVASSMFSAAIDLSLLFRTSMDSILKGLTSKYIHAIQAATSDISAHQELEKCLSDLTLYSYGSIDTYNYVINSTSPAVERLWRLIDHYLTTFDGVNHRYVTKEFADGPAVSTVLMKIVADKLLSAGCDVPASLRRMYMMRNTPELLKLMIKYDRLLDAAELSTEMINRILEPASIGITLAKPFTASELAPVYLPTHLIILLISYLNEDATDTQSIKTANALSEKLNKFRKAVTLQ